MTSNGRLPLNNLHFDIAEEVSAWCARAEFDRGVRRYTGPAPIVRNPIYRMAMEAPMLRVIVMVLGALTFIFTGLVLRAEVEDPIRAVLERKTDVRISAAVVRTTDDGEVSDVGQYRRVYLFNNGRVPRVHRGSIGAGGAH